MENEQAFKGNDILHDDRGFIEFISLVYSRLIRPFERLFHDKLTNLQILTLCILRQNGATSVTELADRLCLSKQQMTKLLSRLYEDGYVRRLSGGSDRRVVLIELTEATEQLLINRRRAFTGGVADIISADGNTESMKEFSDCIARLTAILSELPVYPYDMPQELSYHGPVDKSTDIATSTD